MLNRVSHIIALVFIFTFSTALRAEEKITIFNKKQVDKDLTVMDFVIGKSTLDQVKEKFKSGNFKHEADAASGIKFLCFKTGGTTIAFESGEKGRSDNVITSIAIHNAQIPYRLEKLCEKSSLIKSKVFINNLSLGMSSDLVKRLKGVPSSSTVDTIIYQFEVQEGRNFIISSLHIRFKDNAASTIRASKIENNTVLQ